jgi:hypothetical protein
VALTFPLATVVAFPVRSSVTPTLTLPTTSRRHLLGPTTTTTRRLFETPHFNLLLETKLLATGDDSNEDDNLLTDDNFDAAGFAKYLAPYALAVVAALLVTGVFVKFVLMDY